MKIDVKKIPPEGLHIETKSANVLRDVDIFGIKFNEPVYVSVFVNITGKTLLVNGKIGTKVNIVCGRCLKEFEQKLINDNFALEIDAAGKDEVDITDNIREEIVIALPLKPLCKKDCKGLCPSCGQDLNTKKCSCKIVKGDIRWEGLGKLKL